MSLIKKICLLTLFLCAVVVFTPMSALAQTKAVVENYLVDMPEVEDLKPETFEELSEVYEYKSEDDERMSFKMRYPKDWTVNEALIGTDFGSSKDIISEIVTFVSPPGPVGLPSLAARSRIFVEYSELSHQISSKNWVLKYMLSRGLTSEGMRVIDEKRTEFYYLEVEEDLTFGIHSVAQINGNKVLLVRYRMPIDLSNLDEQGKSAGEIDFIQDIRRKQSENKPLQKASVDSFKILEPTDEYVESLLEYQFLDLALVRYPRSWRQKAKPIRSIDRMEVGLFRINYDKKSKARVLEGRIDVDMVNFSVVEALDKENEILQRKMLGDRLILGEEANIPENIIPDSLKEQSDFFENFTMKSYRAKNSEGRVLGYEFWVSKVLVGDYYFFFTMLTPSQDDNFFSWSQNIETYKQVLASFDPNLDNAFYDE